MKIMHTLKCVVDIPKIYKKAVNVFLVFFFFFFFLELGVILSNG